MDIPGSPDAKWCVRRGFNQRPFGNSFPNFVLDQVPGSRDFSYQINAIGVNKINNRGYSQARKATRRQYRRHCFDISSTSAGNQIESGERTTLDVLSVFWTMFGQIPTKISRQRSKIGSIAFPAPLLPHMQSGPSRFRGHVSKFPRDVIAAPQQLSINDNATPMLSETPGISIV